MMARERRKGSSRGFTLIELMMAIAIIGVLAAVAIPSYIKYQSIAKENCLQANFQAAVGLIRNEIAKRNAGGTPFLDTPADFATELNRGDKRSVYDPTLSAFAVGGTGPGTVVIDKPAATQYSVSAFDHTGAPRVGNSITVVLE